MPNSTLVKAQLISNDGGETITFMFNPDKITIKKSVTINESQGARTTKGLPKMTFSHPNPRTITISNIRFDTYESGKSVMAYVEQFEKALEFVSASEERPPTYIFTWGSQKYIRCFIDDLTYDLTMFLPDGTPVRAVINSLTLKEVDDSIGAGGSASRQSGGQQLV